MKPLLTGILLASAIFAAKAQEESVTRTYNVNHSKNVSPPDSVELKIDSNVAYYQKTVKVDSNIKVSMIYERALEFAAAKNFQQNYGYEPEGKMIFTTTQDLNTNPIYGGDNDDPDPYTVQFALIIDMKNGRYQYTIDNVIFYLPTQNGSRRFTLYDLYEKETGDQPRRIQKNAKKIIDSFDRYLVSLTGELYKEVEHKSAIFNPKY
jgi:hypothetical protein